jgi:hypothetical protein
MENKVGKNLPSDTEFAALVKRVQDVLAELRKFCITLSKEERTTRIHPAYGFEEVAEQICDLSERYGATLTDAPVSEIRADLHLVRMTATLETLLQAGSQLISDTRAQAAHEYAQGAFVQYGVLSALAPHKPELAAAIRPVKAFLTPPRKRAADAPAAPATPAAGDTKGGTGSK